MEEMALSRRQTPIEIALDIDETGHTTARRLYAWLELRPGDYSRWVNKNIVGNKFAEEGKDYSALMRSKDAENPKNAIDTGFVHSASTRSEQGHRGNFAQDYRITASFAKRLAMASNSARGEETRRYFLKVEEALAKAAVRQPMTETELVLWSAQRLVELERKQKQLEADTAQLLDQQAAQMVQVGELKLRQDKQDEQLRELKAAQTTHPEGEFTIAGFASLNGIRIDVKEASYLGKMATSMCRSQGITIGKIKDPRFGSVHLYPIEILQDVFMLL